MNRRLQLLAAALLLSVPLAALAQAPPASDPGAPVIAEGSTVTLEYTLTDDAGAVLGTTKGLGPLTYTQGEQRLLPRLEKELTGLHSGDEKTVVVKPEDGYAAVDPAAQTEVPKELVPANALTVGTRLVARNAAGGARPVTVKEVKDTTVVLDLNHPLAGKTLVFEIKILGVEAPRAAEPKPTDPKPAD